MNGKVLDNKRLISSWCLYDWANSSFTTLVVTFVYGSYFVKGIATDVESGTFLWAWGISGSAMMIALASPLLGALADQGGTRKTSLVISTLICVAATAVLTFIAPSTPLAPYMAIAIFMLANTAFEMGMVFYNAYLPDIAPRDSLGRVSGYGWGLGYGGGILCLVAALVLLAGTDPLLPVSTAEGFNYRSTNLLVAIWFLLFSLPFFSMAPKDNRRNNAPLSWTAPFRELFTTLSNLRSHRQVVLYLLAHLIYNDGLVTVFAFGGVYAAGTFGMPLDEVIVFGIALNIVAGFGSLFFGPIDDKIGAKKTILITLAALFSATILGALAPNKHVFWIAGILIGFFVGPNQAASRSLMGRLAPAGRNSEFFGFYALSGKITSFLGPFLLGNLTLLFNSQRVGIASIALFFLAGALLLIKVDEA